MNKINIDSFWLPRQLSTFASKVDSAWSLVLWVSIAFFFLVVLTLAFVAVRFRRRHEGQATSQVEHNAALEVTWTAIPMAILIGLFVVGFRGYLDASVAPAEAFEIQATGAKWVWAFTYPNGTTTTGELRLPKGKPVKMILSSKDVIHSFYIPEFRVKQDVVPGQYTTVWFEPTEVAETVLECTQYCGTGHSDMLAKVIVMEEPKFKEWLESGGEDNKLPPAEMGKKLFVSSACAGCHSLDGTRMTGPSFKGLFGRTEECEGGLTVKVDENYIRESITNPTAKIVKTYPAAMPVFKGVLNDKQIDSIIAFIKAQK